MSKGIFPRHVIFVALGFISLILITLFVSAVDAGFASLGYSVWFSHDKDPSEDTEDLYPGYIMNTTSDTTDGAYSYDNVTNLLFILHDSGDNVKEWSWKINRTVTQMQAAGSRFIRVYIEPATDMNLTDVTIATEDSVTLKHWELAEMINDTGGYVTVNFTAAEAAEWRTNYGAKDMYLICSSLDTDYDTTSFFFSIEIVSQNVEYSSGIYGILFLIGDVICWVAVFFIIKDNHFPNLFRNRRLST